LIVVRPELTGRPAYVGRILLPPPVHCGHVQD